MKFHNNKINIDKLIEAAIEIDRKAQLQEDRAKKMQELARQARSVVPDSVEHNRIKAEAKHLSTTVVDFGNAINALRRALGTIK